MALLAHGLRGGSHTDLAARRFSAVALWCFLAVLISGIVNALIRISPGALLSTPYGLLVLAKAVALLGLGGNRLAAAPKVRSRH